MCTNLLCSIEINALRFGINNVLLFLWNVIQFNRILNRIEQRNSIEKKKKKQKFNKIYSVGNLMSDANKV